MRTSVFSGSVQSRNIDALFFESRARLLYAVNTRHPLARAISILDGTHLWCSRTPFDEQGCTDG